MESAEHPTDDLEVVPASRLDVTGGLNIGRTFFLPSRKTMCEGYSSIYIIYIYIYI